MRISSILSILAVILLSGAVAYVGDRVGHQVGRKRLSLFGLRPRYTSTVVAIGTGMMIALTVILVALAASNNVRTAFFRLGELQTRIGELEAQRDQLDAKVHNSRVIVYKGQPMYPQFLELTPTQSHEQQLRNLERFFDTVVTTLNRQYVPQGLKAYTKTSKDKDIQAKLAAYLQNPAIEAYLAQKPLILLAVASENLFPNDQIHFEFKQWADSRLYAKGDVIAHVVVDGGASFNTNFAFSQLLATTEKLASDAGMPPYFAHASPIVKPGEIESIARQIRGGKGKFEIDVQAAQDIYPHLGALPVVFVLRQNAT